MKGMFHVKQKFYSLKNVLSKNAVYNLIFGERSNGKTYSVLKHALQIYAATGKQLAIVRRWEQDFVGKRGASMWAPLVENDEIRKATKGEWTSVHYFASRWFLCRYNEKGERETDERPIAYGFSITSMEHDKSTGYPGITTILFDEFISHNYVKDEFVLFMNVVSTIVRHRKDVTIFMLGNTVNPYCPYFREMGLKHVKDMKQGDIDIYTYGESALTVAVEYCSPLNKKGKDSDFYFAFDNPKLAMITGGAWELNIYPHCPCKYRPADILFTYFIEFSGDLLQCEIVQKDENLFTFIHRKTTPLKDGNNDIVFSPSYSPAPNRFRKITKPTTRLQEKIAWFYKTDRVFYQDNEVGEIVRNYLRFCVTG